MKSLKITQYLLLFSIALYACNSPNSGDNSGDTQRVELTNNEETQEVEVKIDGKLFTAYCYSDSLLKQILYPIMTEGGNYITRGWPIEPREGEQTDHPHQRGMWLNYGDVNGFDFWGNSYAIPKEERETQKGRIEHAKIDEVSSGKQGKLVTHEKWLSPFDKELLSEKTTYYFNVDNHVRIIDRITTLTATDTTVRFKDTKEGMFGIRYNRFLHLPQEETETFLDAQGNPTEVSGSTTDATGNYLSSEGVTGEDVWSTRARWMDLYGEIGGEKVSLVICDHPQNFDYPTYWHARGYGLFAANPFGAADFTDGKLTIDFSLPQGDSITFRYRILVSSGTQLTKEQIEKYATEFNTKYW